MTTMEELRAEMEARLEHVNRIRLDPDALRSGGEGRGMLERIRDRLGLNGWAAATNF